jgi:hypothetical protein
VAAAPEKLFFISMITKDIELLPSIADLVDNSVDGARSIRPNGDFGNLFVRISFDPDSFTIADNCGGIDIDIARHYAFRFGRPTQFKGIESSVGQFGVGMKRALFKLGDHFTINSVAQSSWFHLTVDVPSWAQQQNTNWSFEFDDYAEEAIQAADRRGTVITVTDLHREISEDLRQSTVTNELAAQLSLQHQSAIVGGLKITINDRQLRPNIPALLSSDDIQPINYTISIESPAGGLVEARIVAGIAEKKGRDDRRNDADADDFLEPPEAGWYVFCNDRLVLAADRTEQTGWGRVVAAYHPQYRRFRGYVYLSAKESENLPWNTTKTGLDLDSAVYRTVREEMYKAIAEVAGILNRQKSEVAASQDEGGETGPITEALNEARVVPVTNLSPSRVFVAPPPPPRRTTPRQPSNLVSIQYSVSRSLLQRVLRHTRLSSGKEVGKVAFDYFVRNEVPDSDE